MCHILQNSERVALCDDDGVEDDATSKMRKAVRKELTRVSHSAKLRKRCADSGDECVTFCKTQKELLAMMATVSY